MNTSDSHTTDDKTSDDKTSDDKTTAGNSINSVAKKAPKPCPRCGSAAGKGNGGSQCQCKKGK